MAKFVLSGATGLLVPGNIDIDMRSFVAVPIGNGQFASVRSVSWHLEPDELIHRFGNDLGRPINGAEVLVPTVIRRGHKWDIVNDRGALAHFQSTGRHLGIFDDAHHATQYANRLHQEQARDGKRRMQAVARARRAAPRRRRR